MSNALKQTLTQPHPYYYALGPNVTRTLSEEAELWLSINRVGVAWHDTEVFLNASLGGELRPFVDALRKRDMVYIGPDHLSRLSVIFSGITIHHCPAQEAFQEIDRLEAFIMAHAKPDSVVGLSCGPTAKVLVHRLYPRLPGVTLIDFGSVWDGYCGRKSRSYMRKQNWERLTRINFGITP